MYARPTSDSVLSAFARIQPGMVAYDAYARKLGVISAIHVVGEQSEGTELTSVFKSTVNAAPVVPTITGTYVEGEKLPELLYVKLARTGFAQVEADDVIRQIYYITPDQVRAVVNHSILLKVVREVILKL